MTPEKSNEGVGYGRPPKQHQFKKGESGNPRGRPKKSGRKPKPGEIDIAGLLNAEFTLPDGERKMSAYEVVCRGLATRAVNERNLRAAIQFVKRCEAYKVIRTPPRRRTHGVLVIPPGATREEIDRQLYEEEVPRPKRTGKNADRVAILEAVAYERVGEGKNKQTTFELVVRVIQRHAFAGNVTAVRMLDELHDRYDQPADSSIGGFLLVPGMAKDIEEFNKMADEQQRQFREAPAHDDKPQDPAANERKGPSNRS
jgi:hypothetical protein